MSRIEVGAGSEATGTRGYIAGILLAAGRGTRFGGDKLLAKLRIPQSLEHGVSLAECPVASVGTMACRNMIAAIPEIFAVVRPGDAALADQLQSIGARVVECATAHEGMGASLACGVMAAADADGWVIALADMPWIAPASVVAVRDALIGGAPIAAPFFRGQRGHPVGFGRQYYADLIVSSGDTGAQSLLRRKESEIRHIEVHDPGVMQDVDTAQDLRPD